MPENDERLEIYLLWRRVAEACGGYILEPAEWLDGVATADDAIAMAERAEKAFLKAAEYRPGAES